MCPSDSAGGPSALEQLLGGPFRDPSLLRAALTHRSFLNETDDPDCEDNERLEFLGDALVDFAAADLVYRSLPDAREGVLTALRAELVRESALAAFARQLGLGAHLRLGRGEEAAGGRLRPTILCDAFEAVVGALFLDRGWAPVEELLMGLFRPALDQARAGAWVKDAKSRFQELAQREWQTTPHYRTVSHSGPDHDLRFVVSVHVGSDEWGVGEGRSKADAARMAAGRAIERLLAERPELGDAI